MSRAASEPPEGGPRAVVADRVFDGSGWHDHAAVLIDEGRVRAIAAAGELPAGVTPRRLPQGAILAPGFIDLQVNGGGGILLNDDPSPAAMRAIAEAHRRFGTTGCLPTLITDSRERMQAAIAAARTAAGQDGILGIHLEGPFISPARPGVHRPDLIARAEAADLERLADLAGAGRSLVTLAPECVPDGFVAGLASAGIRVSAGHSEASAATMLAAIDEGLTGVTHLYNAMPPLMARDPGIVGAALADRRLTAGLICDGLHVDPVSVRAAFAAKGADAIALVTDAMPTVGATISEFMLMGRPVRLRNGRLTTADGTLAGAHLDMAAAVRNAVRQAGIGLADALTAATRTPARFLGLDDERGVLRPGARADMVGLDADLEPVATWIGGRERPASGSRP